MIINIIISILICICGYTAFNTMAYFKAHDNLYKYPLLTLCVTLGAITFLTLLKFS